MEAIKLKRQVDKDVNYLDRARTSDVDGFQKG
jgi:hypothetical protein